MSRLDFSWLFELLSFQRGPSQAIKNRYGYFLAVLLTGLVACHVY